MGGCTKNSEILKLRNYDKVDYYYEKALDSYLFLYSKKETELKDEDITMIQQMAGNHIGFFLNWIILHHFEGNLLRQQEAAMKAVCNESMQGVDVLLQYCDGKFNSDDVCEAIRGFVNVYYDAYMPEYSTWVVEDLCDLPMEFVGTWDDYHEFEHVIDEAYQNWLKR